MTAGISAAGPEYGDTKPTKAQTAALFDGWNAALRTGDADKAADRYASDAVLLPTVSDRIRTGHAGIVDHFDPFPQDKPVGRKVRTIVNHHSSAIPEG